jgi:ABC-2 type transport system permease protein
MLFLILYLVFAKIFPLGKGIPHYTIYLLLGIVIWNFFTEMTTQSLGSIVGRGDLIRKIRIPRWIIIVSTSLSALINLALNLLVVSVFMFFNHVALTKTALWLPLIFLEVYVFALGISLFLSAAFVKFRDIQYIWEVLLQGGFYLTPIIYPLSRIANPLFKKIVLLNPMAQSIQDARYSLVTHQSATAHQIFGGGPLEYLPFVIVVVFLILGVLYFKKESKFFAENI